MLDLRVGALPGEEAIFHTHALGGEGFVEQLRHYAIVRQRFADKGWPFADGDTDLFLALCRLAEARAEQQGGEQSAHAVLDI